MSFPRLIINKEKLKKNILNAKELCAKNNIELVGVTKAINSEPELIKLYVESGIKILADSRIKNLKKIKQYDCVSMLLRVPMLSELDEVVKYADISVQSEYLTIKKLNILAKQKSIIHKVLLFIELGDLREGFNKEELYDIIPQIIKLENIRIIGIGANLTCYGGVIPEHEKNQELVDFCRKIENKYNIELRIISGGNSSSLYLLYENGIHDSINQLRLGESILLGRETAFGQTLNGFYDDVFQIQAEIVEIKVKPSVPKGKIGMNAFGESKVFEERGNIKRAILAIGRKEIEENSILPFDDQISILDASSDYLIIDISNCVKGYNVGDLIQFKLKYGSLVRVFNSEIEKVYL